ncbi:MAG: YqzL family protein [Candidatus Eremiobacteraeota bacterium]|nr:YqzL family protein [Candidatus Eremiobacteraeota bacterium]
MLERMLHKCQAPMRPCAVFSDYAILKPGEPINIRRSATLLLSPELFWKLFLTTGSIKAYLLYKRMAPQDSH